jgi:hypothetical protein
VFKKFFCALTVLVVGLSVALAEEFTANISKVADGKVTFTKMKKGKADGEAMTLPAAADVKVVTAKFNKETKKVEAGEHLADGLKNEKLSNIGDKGLNARIVTDADGKNITEIRLIKGGGKKKAAN